VGAGAVVLPIMVVLVALRLVVRTGVSLSVLAWRLVAVGCRAVHDAAGSGAFRR
jgi:hypothetical protein